MLGSTLASAHSRSVSKASGKRVRGRPPGSEATILQMRPGKPADRLVKEERAQSEVSCVRAERNISIGTARWVGGASLDRAFVQNMPHARAGGDVNE